MTAITVDHKSLAEALVEFQAEAPKLPKDADNPHFKSKFTSLEGIRDQIQDLLGKHGLAWSTYPCFGPNGEPALRYELTHVSGETKGDVMPLLVTKQDPQGQGSGITYGRRYAICAVLNLVSDVDDDGNSASRPQQQERVLTHADIQELQAAAKGLSGLEIKQAMTTCAIPIPDPFVWNQVPVEKVPLLIEALKAEAPVPS